jgi:hypothetical protein
MRPVHLTDIIFVVLLVQSVNARSGGGGGGGTYDVCVGIDTPKHLSVGRLTTSTLV